MAPLGSASLSKLEDKSLTVFSVIFTTKIGFPLHSTTFIWPGTKEEISTWTGAPAASALALGLKALRKGIARNTVPTEAINPVIKLKNFLLPGFGGDIG